MNKEIVGITASTFDLLHAGHILMLREAKSVCDHLIVALQLDPSVDRPEKNKPVQTYMERYIQLSAVKYVDEIIIYDSEQDLYELLQKMKPDIRILGTDYKDKSFTGDDLDIPIYFHKRDHNYSTSSLREKIKNTK